MGNCILLFWQDALILNHRGVLVSRLVLCGKLQKTPDEYDASIRINSTIKEYFTYYLFRKDARCYCSVENIRVHLESNFVIHLTITNYL